ncbi:MAG: response regulator [Nitrospirae bacterium]|nr:MAG: response regulator [Nitrospirota bacterium]
MKRILLVDDDPHARSALRLVLESQGYDCLEASNGAEALSRLEQESADLVITDNLMPVLGGLEFVQRLREKVGDRAPRTIILSGNLGEDDKRHAQQLGAFAVLDKPCDFKEFLSLVALALQQQD